jgi:hypothetical protein
MRTYLVTLEMHEHSQVFFNSPMARKSCLGDLKTSLRHAMLPDPSLNLPGVGCLLLLDGSPLRGRDINAVLLHRLHRTSSYKRVAGSLKSVDGCLELWGHLWLHPIC